MFIVIFGAGAVGSSLACDFSKDGHDVAVIEKDPEACQTLALKFDGLIIQGDGSTVDVLADAGIGKADCFAAVTGMDKDNMIACGLAKRNFKVPRTIGRVNDPAHEKIFPMMGVDLPVSATRIIAKAIETETAMVKELTMLTMKDGEMMLVKYSIGEECPVIGKPLREIPMPGQARVSIVEHLNEVYIPHGETVISIGDQVYVIMKRAAEETTRKLFLGEKAVPPKKRATGRTLV